MLMISAICPHNNFAKFESPTIEADKLFRVLVRIWFIFVVYCYQTQPIYKWARYTYIKQNRPLVLQTHLHL